MPTPPALAAPKAPELGRPLSYHVVSQKLRCFPHIVERGHGDCKTGEVRTKKFKGSVKKQTQKIMGTQDMMRKTNTENKTHTHTNTVRESLSL